MEFLVILIPVYKARKVGQGSGERKQLNDGFLICSFSSKEFYFRYVRSYNTITKI